MTQMEVEECVACVSLQDQYAALHAEYIKLLAENIKIKAVLGKIEEMAAYTTMLVTPPPRK